MTETEHLLPDSIRPIRFADGVLYLLDQRRLPQVCVENRYEDPYLVATAIRDMVVRGAPAIGITAAFAVVLACQNATPDARWRISVEQAMEALANSRPTAVNLFWALRQMREVLEEAATLAEAQAQTLELAQRLLDEDIAANRQMGQRGAALIDPGKSVLTHCNTGSLATGGFGTALGVIRYAWAEGRISQVFADETRPWLQGARLTAWELVQDGVPVQLLCEGAAASLLQSGQVGWVIVGADRIAANGDTANKIGTYGLAVLARAHGVKFMVVAPCSTIDFATHEGRQIPIEMRSADEVLMLAGQTVAAPGAKAWNPAFDVTPAHLIDAIVSERGVILHPDLESLARWRDD